MKLDVYEIELNILDKIYLVYVIIAFTIRILSLFIHAFNFHSYEPFSQQFMLHLIFRFLDYLLIILSEKFMLNLSFKDYFILTISYHSLHTFIVKYLNLKNKGLTTHKIMLMSVTFLGIISEILELRWIDKLWDIDTGAILPLLTHAWFTTFALV